MLKHTLYSFFVVLLFQWLFVFQTSSCMTFSYVKNPPVMNAYHLTAYDTLSLDGNLDEPFWSHIQPATNFRQRLPDEGDPATERTEVRAAYNNEHIYFGFIFFDREPYKIYAYKKRRDSDFRTDDFLMMIIDTFRDNRSAYEFEINAGGAKGDALIVKTGQGTQFDKAWDGLWEAKVQRGNFGWSAEIKIPFSTLAFDPKHTSWGVNFRRIIKRKNEKVLWSSYRKNHGLYTLQYAGVIRGLENLPKSQGLEIRPYSLSGFDRNMEDGNGDVQYRYDAGLDVSYGITSTMRAALTINTEFAEVEVDKRRVNLTRFPLKFSEKRNFFLENSSVFRFAPKSNIYPYFSRRIGLEEGKPIPINVGGRLVGRVNPFHFGLLHVRTGGKDSIPSEDFTVFRGIQNLLKESSIGLIYTRRARSESGSLIGQVNDRHTLGADLNLRTSNFLDHQNLQFQAFTIWHNSSDPDDQRSDNQRMAHGLGLLFPNRPWFGRINYQEVGSAFDPSVGFVKRRDYKKVRTTLRYAPLIDRIRAVREIRLQYDMRYYMDHNFQPRTMVSNLTFLRIHFESEDRIIANLRLNYEKLQDPFDIKRDSSIIVPPGDYYMREGWVKVQTANYRRIASKLQFTYGRFWSGKRTQYKAELIMKPSVGVKLTGNLIHNQIHLKEGDFNTTVVRTTGKIGFNPDLSFTMILQYDNLSRQAGLYTRFRWILQPGTDLYLVYSRNMINEDDRFSPMESKATAKVTYTYWF